MNLALFDFDGTMTNRDTWTPFLRLAARRPRMFAGRVLLAPVVVGYRFGMVSASAGRQIAVRVGLQGEDAAAVRRLGSEYAMTMLPRAIRKMALERIEWHKAQGDHVTLVSAGLDVYLAPWCEYHGLDYICTTLEQRGRRLTGRYLEGDCCGAEKVRRILQRIDLSRYDVVYAYGDSFEDREMLDLAHRKFYRWNEISSWDDVTPFGHPSARDETTDT
jgi:HAD superfamily hydrolase (TIGR01490 family)